MLVDVIRDNNRIDGVSAVTLLAIAAFAIDRVTNLVLFGLGCFGPWRLAFPDPRLVAEGAPRIMAERRQRIAYFSLATLLAFAVLFSLNRHGLFYAVGFPQHWLDFPITVLLLVAGADKIGELAKMPGASADKKDAPPLKVTGRLILDQALEEDDAAPKLVKTADAGR